MVASRRQFRASRRQFRASYAARADSARSSGRVGAKFGPGRREVRAGSGNAPDGWTRGVRAAYPPL